MYPQRIICLTEEYVELLYLLNEDKKIVGISTFVKRPEIAIKEKPIVTSFIKANIEKINQLQPDLILGFSDIQAEIARELILNHHNVFITNQRTIEEIFKVLFWISSLVHKQEEYLKLQRKWQKKLNEYKNKTKNINRKYKVFFMEWDNPIISGICWVEELLEYLNVEICFPELKFKKQAKERIISKEELLKVNPDIIINSWCGKKTDFKWLKETFQETNAVKNNRIYEIDPAIILQPGPAIFEEGIDVLYNLIYG
ncbi:MAG: cobalamin-binding protein [Leptospiraceae bacterium]|nr:MAG: cobalamin-binding protein [Leptospiraceae bacterium]